MEDVVLTGASRGIGRALARALAAKATEKKPLRLVLVARDSAALESLARQIESEDCAVAIVSGDLSTVAGARTLGERLASVAMPGATLVHNAGIWPAKRLLTTEGLESAFAVNHLGPLAMQEPLLASKVVRRILVVGAGAMVKGRFDAERTPTGADFSALRTYCSTKLAFAIAMRGVARNHSDVDVIVVHPGVARTELGARTGVLGWLLERVKRRWEAPETCAERLVRILARDRWSPPGEAKWLVEETEQSWPRVAEDLATTTAVLDVTERLLARRGPRSTSSPAQ